MMKAIIFCLFFFFFVSVFSQTTDTELTTGELTSADITTESLNITSGGNITGGDEVTTYATSGVTTTPEPPQRLVINQTVYVEGDQVVENATCPLCGSTSYVWLSTDPGYGFNLTLNVTDPRIANPGYQIRNIITTTMVKFCANGNAFISIGAVPLSTMNQFVTQACACNTCSIEISSSIPINAPMKQFDSFHVNWAPSQKNVSGQKVAFIGFRFSFNLTYDPSLVTTAMTTMFTPGPLISDPAAEDEDLQMWIIIVAAVAGFIFLCVLFSIIIFLVQKRKARRRRQLQASNVPLLPMDNYGKNPLAQSIDSQRLVEKSSAASLFLVESDGKYDIKADELSVENELGRGAFGTVYKGKWRSTPVAVKRLKAEMLNEQIVDDFLQEAIIMMRLKNHPNVVTFLGICQNPLCLVTELLDNGSLEKYLKTKDLEIDFAFSCKLIRGIAAGMHHLQCENLVHKDLAARNILLGKDFSPKVSDFGLSRLHNEENQVIYSKTDTGPLKWMAPESLNKKQYSVKSDVWSFGITCVEIFTRNSPYPDLDLMQFTQLIIKNDLKPIRYLSMDTVTLEMYTLVNSCFAEEPNDRPDFAQLIYQLDNSVMVNLR